VISYGMRVPFAVRLVANCYTVLRFYLLTLRVLFRLSGAYVNGVGGLTHPPLNFFSDFGAKNCSQSGFKLSIRCQDTSS